MCIHNVDCNLHAEIVIFANIRNLHTHPAQQQNNLEQFSQSCQQDNNRYSESKIQVCVRVPAPPSNETQMNKEENDTPKTEMEKDIQNKEDNCITSEEAIEGN